MAEGGRWKRLRSEMLMETPCFSLRSDRLRLPDGIKDPYYVIERPDAAIIFPLTLDGEVVLVSQYRPPLETMELGLPAGLVEAGERPETAARRELSEDGLYRWRVGISGRCGLLPSLQGQQGLPLPGPRRRGDHDARPRRARARRGGSRAVQ